MNTLNTDTLSVYGFIAVLLDCIIIFDCTGKNKLWSPQISCDLFYWCFIYNNVQYSVLKLFSILFYLFIIKDQMK